MKDKQAYDKSRHFDIKVNGRKAQILKYLFKADQTGKKCIVLKTKIRNNLITECDWHIPCTLEIPTEEGVLIISGIVCAYSDAPNMCEIWLEIIP